MRGLALAIWLVGVLAQMSVVVPATRADEASDYLGPVLSLGMFTLLTCGALIVSRWPGNVMGWIFCGVGLLDALQTLGFFYEHLAGAGFPPPSNL